MLQVVFAGFSAESLAQRIIDCRPKVVITCNAVRRGSKIIYLKEIVDSALLESAQKGIVTGEKIIESLFDSFNFLHIFILQFVANTYYNLMSQFLCACQTHHYMFIVIIFCWQLQFSLLSIGIIANKLTRIWLLTINHIFPKFISQMKKWTFMVQEVICTSQISCILVSVYS